MDDARLTRRASLLGALGGALGLAGWKVAEAEASGGPAAVASGAVSCVLDARADGRPVLHRRREAPAEHHRGEAGRAADAPADVVDVSSCRPIAGAAVDIWHADASGVYSGFGAGSGNRTFLRGVQRTNAAGVATFESMYPGWYPGRTVHIHVKVHVGGNVVHTGQLFFDDAFTDAVYRRLPYSRRPNRSTRNATDSIFVNGGSRSLLAVRKSGTGYTGAITMGVHRS